MAVGRGRGVGTKDEARNEAAATCARNHYWGDEGGTTKDRKKEDGDAEGTEAQAGAGDKG